MLKKGSIGLPPISAGGKNTATALSAQVLALH
jgi:hypothetical protein